jgi:hypothetical protein
MATVQDPRSNNTITRDPEPAGTPVSRKSLPRRAVDDEDPDGSPMDGLTMPTGPAQPYDVEKVERDRRKSQGPASGT